jgi:transcriptional regulator with XRE-family HTH domain
MNKGEEMTPAPERRTHAVFKSESVIRTFTGRAGPSQPLDEVFAKQLKAARGKRPSQQELADKIGEKQPTIARIESGKRSISVAELFRLCYGLNVPPIEILAAAFDPADVAVAGAVQLSPELARQWILGEYVPEGGNEAAYFENQPSVSEDERIMRRLAFREREKMKLRRSWAMQVLLGRAEALDEEARQDVREVAAELSGPVEEMRQDVREFVAALDDEMRQDVRERAAELGKPVPGSVSEGGGGEA